MKVFLYADNSLQKEAVNIEKYSSIRLDKKKLEFFNTLTDRVNWDFKTEELAQKAYNEILLQYGNKILIED